MGRNSRIRSVRAAVRGGRPSPELIGQPKIRRGGPRGKKTAVIGSATTPLVCRYWRGGRAAQDELARLGITEIRHDGSPVPGENTLARECGLGNFTPTLLMFGVCERGDPGCPRATLACHAAQAAGITTTPCKDQTLEVREDFDLERALREVQLVEQAMTAALRRKAGQPPAGRF